MVLGKQIIFFSRPHVEEGAPSVAQTVQRQTKFLSLRFEGDWFGDDDAEELGAALAENTTLVILHFFGCSFGARGWRSIAEALKTSRTITEISLWHIKIGDAGAEMMADLLLSNSSLKSLYMCGTLQGISASPFAKEFCKGGQRYFPNWDISAIGATAIAKALKTNTTLKVLNMYGNKIGDAGAAALADALASTTSLKRLYLCSCGIEMQGGLALGRAWGTNLALSLDLDLIGEFDDNRPLIQQEAGRVRALALLRREKLVAFGMAMIKRLGGGQGEEEGSTTSSREASVFYYMCKDVFRLIGEAYQY